MGSRSDLPVMSGAVEVLKEFGVTCETQILSAHRTPKLLEKKATDWLHGGIKVIIAGAGGAAHLPGMLASFSPLPVIGVPVKTATLNGLDSLLSIAQMPFGIPVATVAINGAKNAGLLACTILSVSDSSLKGKVVKFKKNLEKKVLKDRRALTRQGVRKFLNNL